jgi:hypothetical protein
MTVHHINVPRESDDVHFDSWTPICGAKDAVLYDLYPQFLYVGNKENLCQDCLDSPEFALYLLGGAFGTL